MLKIFSKVCLVLLMLLTTVVMPVFAGPKVAMITSESGLGDKSFNDMMVVGLERAKIELGATYVVVQPRAISEFQSALARASGQGFDIIIGSSFDMIEPMKAVAASFPNQKFGLVDVGPQPLGLNIVSSVTKDWEGSFLVGYIAAKTSKTGTIGFVGGKDIPIIHRFFIGYYYGAKTANPDIKLLETYTGSFIDPAGGKEFTLSNIKQGADINFAVAGPTSVGVIEAAKSSHTFAIGVDSNQNYLAPGSVLTSMVKRVDTQTFDMIKSVDDNTFIGNKVKMYGLAEDGVSAAMDDNNKGLISNAVLAEIDTLKAKILAGNIVVPNYFDLKAGQAEMGTPPVPTPPSIATATKLAK